MAGRRRKKSKSKKIARQSLIKNYGLLWRRDKVFWGKGSNKGNLIGRRSNREIPFRDQIGIYVLYDENRRPIYVGQTGRSKKNRLLVRLRAHTRNHLALRWQYFSWFGLLAVNKNGSLSGWDKQSKRVHSTLGSVLDEMEGVLIAATEPANNKQGAKFSGIPLYKQVPDSEADYVSNKQIRDELMDLPQELSKSLLAKLKKLLKPKKKAPKKKRRKKRKIR